MTGKMAFRSRVVMARHGFGRGEYRYFAYPLPGPVEKLRTGALSASGRHRQWLAGKAGPNGALSRATMPIISPAATRRVRPGPRRCCCAMAPAIITACTRIFMAQKSFPLQVAVLLSEPGKDFTGGEFVLTEQRPRMQSRAMVVPLGKGDGVCFAVNSRPVKGTRGTYQVKMRHGVSRLRNRPTPHLGHHLPRRRLDQRRPKRRSAPAHQALSQR